MQTSMKTLLIGKQLAFPISLELKQMPVAALRVLSQVPKSVVKNMFRFTFGKAETIERVREPDGAACFGGSRETKAATTGYPRSQSKPHSHGFHLQLHCK
ncbi:hypothetical protein FQN60_003526, partial [Etheostoma spectabile]